MRWCTVHSRSPEVIRIRLLPWGLGNTPKGPVIDEQIKPDASGSRESLVLWTRLKGEEGFMTTVGTYCQLVAPGLPPLCGGGAKVRGQRHETYVPSPLLPTDGSHGSERQIQFIEDLRRQIITPKLQLSLSLTLPAPGSARARDMYLTIISYARSQFRSHGPRDSPSSAPPPDSPPRLPGSHPTPQSPLISPPKINPSTETATQSASELKSRIFMLH